VFADDYLTELHVGQIERELSQHTLEIRGEVDTILGEMSSDLAFIGVNCDRLLADSPGKIDGFLQDAVGSKSYYQSIYLVDQQHRVRFLGLEGKLAGQAEDYRGLDLSRHDLPAADGHRHPGGLSPVRWSEVFVSVTTGAPSLSLSFPLDHGMLLCTVNLSQFGTVLRSRLAGSKDVEFVIIDHHGTLVAHSNQEMVLQRTNLLKIHPEIVEAIVDGREVGIKLHEDESLLESVRVTTDPKWVVHASLSRVVALMPLRQVRMLLLVSLTLAVLVSIILAFWLSRRISRPLLGLHDTAVALARGDYATAAAMPGARFREVDDLAGSFRLMAETVRDRELTLRENEGRFRSLVEGMGEGLIIVNRDGVVVDSNPAAERFFGLEHGALIGAGPLFGQWTTIREDGSIFPEELHPARIALRDGIEVSNQLMGLQRPDGREIWIQINCRPLFAAGGVIDKVLVTFSDVTGLKVAEASLRLSKLRFQELYQQFSALLEGITDRIVLISPDWTLLWSNQLPGRGCIDTEAVSSVGCCYAQFFNRSEPCPGCPASVAFSVGEPAFGEMSASNGRIWNMRAFPVFGKGGTISSVVMIAEDITDKRENDRQRTRAGQLAALGELAAGVAHEINNPISGVINYAQLILNRAVQGSREHDLAQRIIREGDRIAVIVRELLTFAREESADVQIVSVREALAEALALCDSLLRKEGVDLRIDLPAELPPVECRSHQIQQLFLNLISNARHALTQKYQGPNPDKQLLVSGRVVEVAGRAMLRLKVRDHGTGIPADLLERVMNPFVTTKPAGVGTGLGLSISFEIAKKHGGSLSIASEHGAWTEVTIDLPAYLAA
jgi:PAS domain S-box-containing protein